MKTRAGDLNPVRARGPLLNVCRANRPGNTTILPRGSDGSDATRSLVPSDPDASLTPLGEVSRNSGSEKK